MQFSALTEGLVSIALAIVGLGIIATLVGKNAQTSAVAKSVAGGFAQDIGAAEAPVTGASGFGGVSSFGNVDLGSMLGS